MSIQYEHLKAWNQLERSMKEDGTQPYRGRITAYWRMKFEIYSALFFFHSRAGR